MRLIFVSRNPTPVGVGLGTDYLSIKQVSFIDPVQKTKCVSIVSYRLSFVVVCTITETTGIL